MWSRRETSPTPSTTTHGSHRGSTNGLPHPVARRDPRNPERPEVETRRRPHVEPLGSERLGRWTTPRSTGTGPTPHPSRHCQVPGTVPTYRGGFRMTCRPVRSGTTRTRPATTHPSVPCLRRTYPSCRPARRSGLEVDGYRRTPEGPSGLGVFGVRTLTPV